MTGRCSARRALAVAWLAAAPACSSQCGEPSGPPAPQLVVPVRDQAHHERRDGLAPPPEPVTSVEPPSDAQVARLLADASLGDLTAYATAKPESGKSVGHTSVVLKLKLEGGLTAAFKPRSLRGPLRYKGEIAAYRLATALGLANVPPAIPRTFSLASLLAASGGKESETGALLVKEAVPDDKGDVPGALVPWIPKLGFLAIETEPLLSQWRGWLNGKADVPGDKALLAAQISTLIVFDYVTGNWDRWSGGNVGYDEARGQLLFIDNDAAFFEAPPAGLISVQKARLDAVTRFSRSFVSRLRKLDPKALAAAMGEEAGAPLLGEKALAGVDARRVAALAHIDARIAKTSEGATLAFE